MDSTDPLSPPWHRSTLAIALVGSLLLWAALPPLSIAPLAWVAPVPWLALVRREQLPGRRPYLALWLAGFAFWLMAIHWLRLPHPALYLGWLALSAYLAFYLPVFAGLSRIAVHTARVPLWLAAPVVWTGLELARAHLLTGFLMGSLAHTQVEWTALIQISDLVGEYGVDFVVMTVAAAIGSAVLSPRSPLAIVPAAIVLGGALLYGHSRLAEAVDQDDDAPTVRIALIQGNSLAEWKHDPSREREIMDQYLKLSERAIAMARRRGDGRPVDLVVWPETMFRTPLVTFEAGYELPPGSPNTLEEITSFGRQSLANLVRRLDAPVLVGMDRAHYRKADTPGNDPPPPLRFNSAVLVGRDGKIIGTYDKVHRVMFGEYIPFAKQLPFLYRLTPLTGGIEAGPAPEIFELNDAFLAPSICYETVIPHVIRRQAATRVGGSVPADVLVNLTNDAWYWGSSELDMHLASGAFRAVETRKPLLIAANGGISAWIDRAGRVRAQSPRQEPDVILADVERGYMGSWYVELGDWFAGLCLAACVILGLVGLVRCGAFKFTKSQGDTETRRQGEV